VVFTLIFEGFPALNKLSLGFFLFIFCALCFIGAPHRFCKFGKFIFAAYYSVIEFVIMLAYFPIRYYSVIEFVIVLAYFPIRALWLRDCFSTCLNDGGTYEDGILEWSKLSLLKGQDEGLAICEEYTSSDL